MTQTTRATRRKPYVRPMKRRWWVRNNHFRRYMLREGTSLLLGLYAIVLLIGIVALGRGEAAYNYWLAALAHPLAILFHLLVFVAACYHTCTWFAVSPKTMPPLRFRDRIIASGQIIAAQYVVLAVISLVILFVVGMGAQSTAP